MMGSRIGPGAVGGVIASVVFGMMLTIMNAPTPQGGSAAPLLPVIQNPAASISVSNCLPLAGSGSKASPERKV